MKPIRHPDTWQSHLSGEFAIVRLEETHRQPASIHRHQHFELICLTTGSIYFIQPGKLHHFSSQQAAKGFLICFTPQFCRLSRESTLSLSTRPSYIQVPEGKQPAMTDLLEFMKHEFDHNSLFRMEVLSEFLKIFLLCLGRLSSEQTRPGSNRNTQIFGQFMALLEKKFLTHRRPADYAEELFLSTSYLNQTVKAVSGRTTSHHIHQRVVLEAQRMAVYSNSSLKEAASNLGFDDICHFSRFFKKAAGKSFKEFKHRSPLFVL